MAFTVSLNDGKSFTFDGHFDVVKTISSGQMFRYLVGDGVHMVRAMDKSLILEQADSEHIIMRCNQKEFNTFWREYFDLNTNYDKLNKFASNDKFLKQCLEYGEGLRLMKQDFWETVVCFILSQRSNIPKIMNSVWLLCDKYGNGNMVTPETLSELNPSDIRKSVRCGYRAKYLVDAACYYLSNRKAFDNLDKCPTTVQMSTLLNLYGVGDKVANCIALFGLHNTELFPVDVWIERIIDVKYGSVLNTYRYGKWAGLIQQYMYFYAINHKKEFT